VADYQNRFLALLTRAGPLLESQQVQLFIAWLGEPLSIDVQLQGPQSFVLPLSIFSLTKKIIDNGTQNKGTNSKDRTHLVIDHLDDQVH